MNKFPHNTQSHHEILPPCWLKVTGFGNYRQTLLLFLLIDFVSRMSHKSDTKLTTRLKAHLLVYMMGKCYHGLLTLADSHMNISSEQRHWLSGCHETEARCSFAVPITNAKEINLG